MLEVQEPELARGRKVESLQVPNHGYERWQDGSEVARPGGYEGELHNTDKHRYSIPCRLESCIELGQVAIVE